MKCSRCDFSARTIKGMGEHARTKHPESMKHRRRRAHKKEETGEGRSRRSERKTLWALYVLLRSYFEGSRKVHLAEERSQRRRERRKKDKHGRHRGKR